MLSVPNQSNCEDDLTTVMLQLRDIEICMQSTMHVSTTYTSISVINSVNCSEVDLLLNER